MAKLAVAALLAALCLFGTARAQTYPNFVAALNNPQFSRLKGVVTNLGLDKTFANPQLKVTVFVPNDQAFANAASISPVPLSTILSNRGIMQQLTYYHIVKEVVAAPLPKRQLTTFVANRFLTGDGMNVKAVGNSAQIVTPNIKCGQGLAHVVNHVLLFVNLGSILG